MEDWIASVRALGIRLQRRRPATDVVRQRDVLAVLRATARRRTSGRRPTATPRSARPGRAPAGCSPASATHQDLAARWWPTAQASFPDEASLLPPMPATLQQVIDHLGLRMLGPEPGAAVSKGIAQLLGMQPHPPADPAHGRPSTTTGCCAGSWPPCSTPRSTCTAEDATMTSPPARPAGCPVRLPVVPDEPAPDARHLGGRRRPARRRPDVRRRLPPGRVRRRAAAATSWWCSACAAAPTACRSWCPAGPTTPGWRRTAATSWSRRRAARRRPALRAPPGARAADGHVGRRAPGRRARRRPARAQPQPLRRDGGDRGRRPRLLGPRRLDQPGHRPGRHRRAGVRRLPRRHPAARPRSSVRPPRSAPTTSATSPSPTSAPSGARRRALDRLDVGRQPHPARRRRPPRAQRRPAVRAPRRPAPTTKVHDAAYPEGPLRGVLANTAALIREDLGTSMVAIDYGDWDMHEGLGGLGEDDWMNSHLSHFARALAAFFTDLGSAASRVTVVTISEFGRRVEENGSGGVDHGYGNAMLLLGAGVDRRRACAASGPACARGPPRRRPRHAPRLPPGALGGRLVPLRRPSPASAPRSSPASPPRPRSGSWPSPAPSRSPPGPRPVPTLAGYPSA